MISFILTIAEMLLKNIGRLLFIYNLLDLPKITVTKRLPAGVSDEVMPAFLFPCGAHSTIIAEEPAIQ